LSPLFDDAEPLRAGLQHYAEVFAAAERDTIARKLGFVACTDADVDLMGALHLLMRSAEVDMTLFFRALADVDLEAPALAPLAEAFYDPEKFATSGPAFVQWLDRYAARSRADRPGAHPLERRASMSAANPKYVLRNYLAQQAIDRAEAGDFEGIRDLLALLQRPYDDQPGREAFAGKRPDWARHRAGCSMLSCSS
jgi:uncharacterized protein YdiU (UPF0061 family)